MSWTASEPMDIDDGQLDTLTPVQAFTLGVEWEMLRTLAKSGAEIHTHPIHTDNARRIERLLSGHAYHQVWEHGDDWSFVTASTEAPE